MIRLLLALRRFWVKVQAALREYRGLPPLPPSADEGVRDRNKREHGGAG